MRCYGSYKKEINEDSFEVNVEGTKLDVNTVPTQHRLPSLTSEVPPLNFKARLGRSFQQEIKCTLRIFAKIGCQIPTHLPCRDFPRTTSTWGLRQRKSCR